VRALEEEPELAEDKESGTMEGVKTRIVKMVGGARVETGAEGVRCKSRVQPGRRGRSMV